MISYADSDETWGPVSSTRVLTGSGADACPVSLTAAAPTGGTVVSLSSSSSVVTVPTAVTVPANAITVGSTVKVSYVATAQGVTMTATAGCVVKAFMLHLNAAMLALSVNATSLPFGDVAIDTTATQTLILSSTGRVPVTVNGMTLTGVAFPASGDTLPATLSPGQSGAACTGAACGTVSSDGLYTSPATPQTVAAVTITATSVLDPSKSGSATVMVISPARATYYLAPETGGGSDSNGGLSPNSPWLTPNHPINCGDMIIAAASTAYASANFQSSKWGNVYCPAGNAVAWLTCASFDGCKIAASNQFAMWVSKSYWGVSGWEVTGTGNNGVCLNAEPTGGATIHHIIFANNVCLGGANGIGASAQSKSAGVDYLAIVGNIAWNAAQSTVLCNSGVSVYEPIASDALPGTHIYIAGNFSFDNATPSNCNAGSSTYDGNGIVLDDVGNAQSGGTAYTQQIVVENNLAIWNGGYGFGNTGNGSPSAPIFWQDNTSTMNLKATNLNNTTCGDLTLLQASHVTVTRNLIETSAATGCLGGTRILYGVAVNAGDVTDTVASNWIYSHAGNSIGLYSNNGFEAGLNTTGSDPQFRDPIDPGKPNCARTASTVDCMSALIAHYKPANLAAQAFGYQVPQPSPVSNPFFPQWLCKVGLPSGLVTMGCPNGQ